MAVISYLYPNKYVYSFEWIYHRSTDTEEVIAPKEPYIQRPLLSIPSTGAPDSGNAHFATLEFQSLCMLLTLSYLVTLLR